MSSHADWVAKDNLTAEKRVWLLSEEGRDEFRQLMFDTVLEEHETTKNLQAMCARGKDGDFAATVLAIDIDNAVWAWAEEQARKELEPL